MLRKKIPLLMDYLLVWFMVMCSGTVLFNIQYNSLFIPLFVCFASVCFWKKGLPISRANIEVCLCIIGVMVLNSMLHIYDGVAWNGIAQNILYILGVWFVCQIMTFKKYKEIYRDIVFVLCIMAMVIQFLRIFDLVPFSWVTINGRQVPMGQGIGFGHLVSWWDGSFYRLSGLFSEPGMFQIIINLALLFGIDNYIEDSNKANLKEIIYAIVFTVALICTRSTAGYLVYGFIMLYLLWEQRKKIVNKYFVVLESLLTNSTVKIIVVGMGLVVIGVCILWLGTSDVIAGKFSDSNVSFALRKNDLLSGIELILSKPFSGYGYKSECYSSATELLNIGNISSGLMECVIAFGVIFLIVILGFLYRAIKKQSWHVNFGIVCVVYLVQNMVQACLFFPVMLIFIMYFDGDKKEKVWDLRIKKDN